MFAILVKYDQGSVEVSCPWRGACARKRGRGCCPCKAANKNCKANCQCRWRSNSCNEVTKLKIIRRPAVRYFSHISLWNPKYIYRKMFDLYLQSSSASRQPTISNLMFFANPVYRVRCHPNAWHLKAFQWHGWTRSSNNSILLSEIYQFFVENIPPSFTILERF